MVIGHDVYHHIRPLIDIHDADRKPPMIFCVPVDWVLSGPLPSSSGALSTCFKCNTEDVVFVSQLKALYQLENYGTSKQAYGQIVLVHLILVGVEQ